MPDNRPRKNRPAPIDVDKVRELRELTGEGLMACKKAFVWAEGDMREAEAYLRRQGNLVARTVKIEGQQ